MRSGKALKVLLSGGFSLLMKMDSKIRNSVVFLDVPIIWKWSLFFPYFGKQSERLKSDILKLFNKYFTNHQFHIILTNNFTIGSLFSYKDRLNKGMTASAVYKWSCPNCRAHYIGSSSRNLYGRAAELLV